jgi:hypothetical protein
MASTRTSRAFARRLVSVVVAVLMAGASGLFGARPAVAQPSGSAVILDRVDRIVERVAALRGLAPREPIPAGLHSRETLRDLLIEEIDEEMTPERIAAEERVLRQLGILSGEVSYRDLLIELLTSQIAGFYDDDTRELYLIDDLPAAALEPTMAHEIFHGIQDQQFGIGEVRGEWDRADDLTLATTALIEGDAVGVMFDYVFGGALSFTDIPNFRHLIEEEFGVADALVELTVDVPPFIQDVLVFPYLHGTGFVHYLKAAAGWEGVNDAYRDPPRSTEQVLHPERYLLGDAPTWVDIGTEPFEEVGFARVYDQVIGEFQWQALFRDRLGETVAARAIDNAATGWDGDRLLALEDPDGHFVIVGLSVWDTPIDADQFAAVLARFLEARDGRPLDREREGPNGVRWRDEHRGSVTLVERWGDMVLFVDGIPKESDDALDWAEVAWTGRLRSPYPAAEAVAPRPP